MSQSVIFHPSLICVIFIALPIHIGLFLLLTNHTREIRLRQVIDKIVNEDSSITDWGSFFSVQTIPLNV